MINVTKRKSPPIPRRTKIVLTVLTAASALGIASGFLFSDAARHSYKALLVAELLFLGVIALAVFLMKTVERRTGTSLYSSVLFTISAADRKRVSKVVNRGRQVDDVRLAPIAIAYADEVRKKFHWLMGIWVSCIAFQVADILTENDSGLHLLALGCYASGAVILIWIRVQSARSKKNKPTAA